MDHFTSQHYSTSGKGLAGHGLPPLSTYSGHKWNSHSPCRTRGQNLSCHRSQFFYFHYTPSIPVTTGFNQGYLHLLWSGNNLYSSFPKPPSYAGDFLYFYPILICPWNCYKLSLYLGNWAKEFGLNPEGPGIPLESFSQKASWMDKEDVVHIYNGILLSHKKEWNNAICSYMDGPGDDHTKWSKSDRERQILYDITYVES